MSDQASVYSLDALKDFRAALIEFCEDAKLAIGEASSDVQRTMWWVQSDQPAHWQRELRNRTNRLNEAKTDLARVQLQKASTIVEKKKVVACQRLVDEAEDKIRKLKGWKMTLDKELMMFKGQCNSLAGVLDGELPKVVAKMERMIDALQQYVSLQAPPFDPIATVTDATGVEPPTEISTTKTSADGAENADGGGDK